MMLSQLYWLHSVKWEEYCGLWIRKTMEGSSHGVL